jgi:uncharacterized protein YerC
MSIRTLNLQEGKLLKEIDFQILMCKERIKNHELSIKKVKRMAGMYGPSSVGGIDYSKQPGGGFSHMAFPDALDAISKDMNYIEQQKENIKSLRKRKRDLIKAAEILEGLEQQIYVYRVIFGQTQDAVAETIGVSTRQLQRVERQMKQNTKAFDL